MRAYPLNEKPAKTLVIHCADPRFQDAIRSFLRDELRLSNWVSLKQGGGPIAFALGGLFYEVYESIVKQTRFFVEEMQIESIILINHQDCKWYRKHQGYRGTTSVDDQLMEDLKTGKQYLAEKYNLSVQTFLAKLEGKQIFFEEVK